MGHIDYRDESIIIMPEEDITRVISITLEKNQPSQTKDSKTLKIDEIRIKKRKI